MKHMLRITSIWLVVFAAMLSPNITTLKHEYRLKKSGIPIAGIVESKVAHQSVIYSFTVNSAEYRSKGRTGLARVPAYESISIGDRLPVYYLKQGPTVSLLGDPTELFKSDFWFCAGLALFAAVAIMFAMVTIRLFPRKSYLLVPHSKIVEWI